jgi:hypothetical protein
MNDIKNKIRAYNKREPITDKRFAFSNVLISLAITLVLMVGLIRDLI